MKKYKISFIFILITIAYFIYVFYKDYFVFSFSLSSHYKKYYLIGIILFILSLFTFLINQKILKNLFIIFLSSAFALQLVNIYFYYSTINSF